MKTQTKGNKVTIDFGHGIGKPTFTAGGRKRYMLGDGMVMVNGLIRFADGTEAHCLLEISELDSGEHFGTGVFLPNGQVVFQDEDDFLSALGKTKDQVYPYKYKYTGKVHCYDHHIGDDGWSH
ncbi:MAG: hypothetical protein CL536_01330 [Alcaligenaceae bacterium]|nr:hypothetical protein [Alcaligenaceae bacterium]